MGRIYRDLKEIRNNISYGQNIWWEWRDMQGIMVIDLLRDGYIMMLSNKKKMVS